jgi:sugar phosphate isomerase/epimerase
MNKAKIHHWELGLFAPSVSQLNVEDTLSLIADSGYQWVEWRVQTQEAIDGSPWGKAYNTLALDTLKADVDNYVPLLKKFGIGVSGLQVEAPQAYPNLYENVLNAAKAMECSHVLIGSPQYDPSKGYRAQKTEFQKQLVGWITGAKGSDIRICVENHMWTITPSCALAIDLLSEFKPNEAGVMWDPANGYWEGLEIPAMALDLLGDYLAEVHFKNGYWKRNEDGKWGYDWCDIPEGLVDWKSVINLIEKAGYHGPLIVEDYRPIKPEDKLMKASKGLKWALENVTK